MDQKMTQNCCFFSKSSRSVIEYLGALSSNQLDSLTTLCDTFVPSIHDASSYGHQDQGNIDDDDDSYTKFLQTSASMNGTPQHIAWMINNRLQHPKMNLCKLALWLLSTRIGTFILCGKASLSTQFPYLQTFSNISPKKREESVKSWATSCFKLLRILFFAAKILVLLVFYTQVNDESQNSSWKALGYSGPDPDFKKQKQENMNSNEKDDQPFGPLYEGIISLKNSQKIIFHRLQELGFSVSKPHNFKNARRSTECPAFIIECDAVVVGSGSGGGVIAGILANAGHKVLVLEKGSYLARTNLSLLEGTSMDQMYLGSGLLVTQDMDIMLLAGSTVGGGSTINWSASIQTPQHVLKEWSESYNLKLFESELYKEGMKIVCEKMGVQSEIEDEGFQNMILRKGCQELGYPVETIPTNAPSDHYCGWCSMGCKDGKKKGTAETWLVDLVKSGNGAILPECEALEVIHEKKNDNSGKSKAIGVAFAFQNIEGMREICMVKSKVTIVACGALSTPSLLKRSGLKNPNIGRNLHLHPVVIAWGYFPDSPSTSNEIWPKAEKKSYEGGIMTAMSKVVANFEGSGYGAIIQTPGLHPGMFSALMPWVSGLDIKMRMRKYSRTAYIFALARDKGSGEALSPYSVSYKLDQTDEENLKAGLEKTLRILAAAGAEEIGTQQEKGRSLKVNEASLKEFERFVKEESSIEIGKHSVPICSAHQMGSCRMGVDPKTSVVNSKGETWEVEGLFLGDSSVCPTAIGVNPMVTIQAISYCTAQSVLQFLKNQKLG
ncbi:long-chain-alcohol oxidase FAO4A-like isoform X1 [Solanum stenotomum]|uniref:long-chain-alcohol oxidase FAO4A-like isoform X1 n=1 Tax=Solanum stenotomum TaxID=172797 RepID=UPI0020D0E226|nr:long-chain-alcohol oxidase FAO4A-like isoform X1 [Solanum stenotomum]